MGTPVKERMRMSRERKASRGLTRTEVIVPVAALEEIRAAAAALRKKYGMEEVEEEEA